MIRFHTFKRCAHDRSGATMVEYALIASLVSLILVASVSLVGQGLEGFYSQMAKTFNAGARDGGNNPGTPEKTAESL
jgi:Flp pilus assembly pilin Flp